MSFFPKFQVPVLHRSSRPDSSRQMSMSLTNKGLLNPSGHNNCFLNSCVQVLWHVDVFRRSFREYKGHTCVGHSCIFCALQALFTQFQHSSQSALPPDDLRQALARCYQEQHRFQLGIMDDAAECFEKLLEQIHFHLTGSDDLDSCSAPHCLPHQKCALSVLEMTECSCGETSEPLAFVQFIHYISAPILGAAAKKMKQGTSYPLGDAGLFGALVKSVSGKGEGRECDTCHRVSPLKKMLLNSPDLVCIGMIWDSDQPSIDDIMSVVESVGTILRVSDIFHRVMSDASSTEYWLSGMVAYYGHHYSTFCYHTLLRQWGYFDDANFRTVSSNWSDVVELCRKAHYQPLLLVYTNPFAERITMTTAPVGVTRVTATDTKTSSLAAVTEDNETKDSDKVNSKQLQSKNDKKLEGRESSKPQSKRAGTDNVLSPKLSAVTTANSNSTKSLPPAASQAQPDKSGVKSEKSKPESGYEIDPLTLSIRPVGTSGTQGSGIYPQLSEVKEEGGREGGHTVSTAPSAPPQSLIPQNTTSSSTNAPIIFQSSPLPRQPPIPQRPGLTPSVPSSTPSFPVHFQPSPSTHPPPPSSQSQHYPPPYNPYPYGVNRPPLRHPPWPQSPSNQYMHRTPARGYTTPAGRVYPPPTGYSPYGQLPHSRPPSNAGFVYPNTSQQTAPQRGIATEGPGGVYQLTTHPQSFLYQSSPHVSPTPSPSLYPSPHSLPKTTPSTSHSISPVSPAKADRQQYVPSAQSSSKVRPRPSPSSSTPPPTKLGSSHSTSAPTTPATGSDNLIEFSLSPASLLSASKSNQVSQHQGITPPRNTTQSDENLFLSASDSSSCEVSPHRPDSRTSTTSLEDDLIQWSLTPGMIQKVQKYRGRQGIRQGPTDNFQPPVKSAVQLPAGSSGRGSTPIAGGIMGSTSQPSEKQLETFSKQAHPVSSRADVPTSVSGVLIDVGEMTEGTGERKGASDKERRRLQQEPVRGQKDVPPDPLYADPDMVHTMMKNIAGNGETERKKNAMNVSSAVALKTPASGADPTPAQYKEGERLGLGEDPLYAVPEQVMAKMRAKKEMSAAQAVEEGKETSAAGATSPTGFPSSVEPVLLEARAMWRKAESNKDTDVPLARMGYSRAATLLMKVLVDPAVAKDKTLRQNISHKRNEALARCNEMKEKLGQGQSSVYGDHGMCSQCGQTRQLNIHLMCGPCHLKRKLVGYR